MAGGGENEDGEVAAALLKRTETTSSSRNGTLVTAARKGLSLACLCLCRFQPSRLSEGVLFEPTNNTYLLRHISMLEEKASRR